MRIFACAIILIGLLSCSNSFAIEQKDSVKHYLLQEIIVQAPRLSINAMTIPFAMSVVNSQTIESSRQMGLNEVLNEIPGILAQSRGGTQDVRLTIRGFGARGAGDRSNAGTSRGIRVLLDNFPETEPDGRTSFDLIDLASIERLEVIRSNVSSLWGNAAGGLLQFSSVPRSDESNVSVQSIMGNYGLRKAAFKIHSGDEEGKWFGSWMNSSCDGWRSNSASSKNLLNAGFSGVLSDLTRIGVFLTAVRSEFEIPGPLSQSQFDSKPEQANQTYANRHERRNNRLGRLGVSLDHDFLNYGSLSATVFVSPKFIQRSERGTFRDFNRYHIGGSAVYKKEFRPFPDIPSTVTLGFDEAYQDGAILFYSLSANNDRGSVLKDNKREGTNNLGFFLQDEMQIDKRVLLTLGARYDAVTYFYESFINSRIAETRTMARWTPKIGLVYLLSSAASVYASMSGGLEVPAGNETDPAGTFGQDTVYALNPLLEPIQSMTYELGTKYIQEIGRGFLQSISWNAAAYRIDVTHDIIPYRGGRFYFTAGKTQRLGFELGLNVRFDYGISVQAAATISSNTYKDYKVDSVHYGKPGAIADYARNKAAGIPDWISFLKIHAAPASFGGVFIEINVQTVGKYFVDDANSIQVPAYDLWNALIGLHEAITVWGQISFRAYVGVNNLLNTRYAASAYVNPDVVDGVPLYLEPGLPRNFYASVNLAFGL